MSGTCSIPPRIVVQKFGGTLLRSPEDRARVVEQIRRSHEQGRQTIVVVSAMGRDGEPYATDTLLHLASEIDSDVDARTEDLLLSSGEIVSAALLAHLLNHAGCAAMPFTGRRQAL